jgi:hypothetical protein
MRSTMRLDKEELSSPPLFWKSPSPQPVLSAKSKAMATNEALRNVLLSECSILLSLA